MSVPVASGLMYDDLAAMPEPGVDGLRKELIDGELYVTPSPIRRHQDAVLRISSALLTHADAHGGKVYPAPMDVYFSERTVVDPTGHYGTPQTLAAGDTLTCLAVPGFELPVTDVLA